jgi:hypothetical protein
MGAQPAKKEKKVFTFEIQLVGGSFFFFFFFFHPYHFPSTYHFDIFASFSNPFSTNQSCNGFKSSSVPSGGFPRILSLHILIIFPLPHNQVNFDWIRAIAILHNFHIGDPPISISVEYRYHF